MVDQDGGSGEVPGGSAAEEFLEGVGVGSVLPHLYRGEIDRVTTWRQRLDTTTNLSVTVIAAIVTWAFSSPTNPHYIILVGIAMTAVFLGIEAHRYREYDIWRSRMRLMQENLYAPLLDPEDGEEMEGWQEELGRDYREPGVKTPFEEAVAHRLRRVYLPLLLLLLIAWVTHVTVFASKEDIVTAAGMGVVPGPVMVGGVAALYVAVLVVAFRPRERKAKGEMEEKRHGEWKGE